MRLFMSSISFCIIGFFLGGFLRSEFFACIFGFIGFMGPITYEIDSIYTELVKNKPKIDQTL